MDSPTERYTVISSDMHAGASIQGYRPYLEERWQEDFDSWASEFNDPWQELDPGPADSLLKVGVASGASPVNWDTALRTPVLDREGISGEVVFPNTAPPFFPSGQITARTPTTREEYDHRWAGIKAHNRWLVDWCAELPERRAGIGQVLFNDIDDAVAEIKFIADSGLRGGVLIPNIDPGSPLAPLYDPQYEPIWTTCAEYDLTLNQHAQVTGPTNAGSGPAKNAVLVTETTYWTHRLLWHMIWAGVPERHPNLRFVLTESRAAWVVPELQALDSLYETGVTNNWGISVFLSEAAKALSMTPSEYFRRNFFIGASFMLPMEVEVCSDISDRIMWGADYPHSEGTYPYTREALRVTFGRTDPKTTRMILGETAAKVYRFDLQKLAPLADRIGPTVQEVQTPVVKLPRTPEDSQCPVFYST